MQVIQTYETEFIYLINILQLWLSLLLILRKNEIESPK